MNRDKFTILVVPQDHENSRLDRFLKRQVMDLKQSQIEKMARKGFLRINGIKANTNARIEQGDEVWYLPPLPSPANSEQTLHLKEPKKILSLSKEDLAYFESITLWEDDDLLVLNKPHGLAVQGGSKVALHIDAFLQAFNSMKNTTYRLVHRLDKDTSGVLIIGKNLQITKHLAEQFKNNSISKIYWAITHGIIQPAMGTIDLPLIKEKIGNNDRITVDHKHGKKAITKYHTMKRLIGQGKNNSLELTFVELHPQTGRTHQLRVHCQALGHPILGDTKYGHSIKDNKLYNLHLHARSICITDLSGHQFTFTAPAPVHMQHTLSEFKCEDIN